MSPLQRGAVALSLATILIASEATAKKKKKIVPDAVLEYSSETCSNTPDLSLAQRVGDDGKALKKMMKNRTLTMVRAIDHHSACLTSDTGKPGPYSLFEIPSDITGRVIYTGAKVEERRTFAASVSLLNELGEITRTFARKKFKVQGTQYGVQFRPREGEVYVMLTAEPAMIGQSRDTIETSTTAQSVVIPYPGGAGAGTNFVGTQKEFSRVYSYEGDVLFRMVFPKQEKKKK